MLIFSKYKYLKNYFLSFLNSTNRRGFTLIELLVVMSIFTLITTALVVQQSRWNSILNLKTQTYDLLLYIRQAQVYGLGVRESRIKSTGDKFDVGYGVFLDMASPDRYIFFADNNKNNKYDTGEAIETKIFKNGVTINRLCVVSGLGLMCSPSLSINKMNLLFFRPDPSLIISTQRSNGTFIGTGHLSGALYVRASSGQEVGISFNQQGQIYIPQ